MAKRKVSKAPRNPRTYYAMSKDKATLFRFANHAHRLDAIRKENLLPVGALEFRELVAADMKAQIKVVDRRGEAPVAEVAATPAQTQAILEGGGEDVSVAVGNAIAEALKPFISKGAIQLPAGAQGAQPAVASAKH